MYTFYVHCDNYSKETTIQGRKLLTCRTFLVQQVFKGDKYSREETIRGNTVVYTGLWAVWAKQHAWFI